MITEKELKTDCNPDIYSANQKLSLFCFDLNRAEFLIKYRSVLYEKQDYYRPGEDAWMHGSGSRTIQLGILNSLKGPFHTRMIFTECNPEIITSTKKFKRWIRIRNVMLVDAMLFIRVRDRLYQMTNEDGPLYLPLRNKHFYSLMKQINAK